MSQYDPVYCENVIYSFLSHFRDLCSDILGGVDAPPLASLSVKMFDFLDISVGHLALISFLEEIFFTQKTWIDRFESLSLNSKFFEFLRLKQWAEERQKLRRDLIKKSFIKVIVHASDDSLSLLAKKVVALKQKQFEAVFCHSDTFNQVHEKKCLLISSIFVPTWQPTFCALKSKGWVLGSVLWSDIGEDYVGYGGMPTKDLPIDHLYFSDPLGAMLFMARADNYPILLSGEAYYYTDWDAENGVILFTLMACFSRAVRSCRKKENNNLFYLMYDGLKPVSKNAANVKNLLSKTYQRYMQSVDRIIYNSNGDSFGSFVENVYGVTAPRLHFPRYSAALKTPEKRLSFGKHGDEYHMVCITACLNESLDATRDDVPSLIRTILSQGIHFHYYNGDSQALLDRFVVSIPQAHRGFFHPYPVCCDQQSLLDELHQYHVGINPADYLAVAKAICSVEDRKYQDAMQAYIRSTYPTSTLMYLSAGLPIVTTLATDRLFKKDSMALFYSEFRNLKNYFKKINLQGRCIEADKLELRKQGEAQTHVHRLVEFMEYKEQLQPLGAVCDVTSL